MKTRQNVRPIYLAVVLVLLAFAVPASPAHAGGVVTECDEAHLLAALAGGGTVTFSCSGTITLTNTIVISADTTIDGSGQDVTISGNSTVQLFFVNPGATLYLNVLTVADSNTTEYGGAIRNEGTVVISDSTISGNRAWNAGGVLNIGTMTVSSSTFSNNSAVDTYGSSGGGIMNHGTLTVTNSVFFGNTALDYGYGGAIYNSQLGTLTVRNSSFTGNSASYGGGIANFLGTATLSKCDFTGNSSGIGGGGIENYGALSVSDSNFSSNSGIGGGMANSGVLMASTNTFVGNTSDYLGGGIFNTGSGELTVQDSAFSDNQASYGGGIGNQDGTVTVSNCTFTANSAMAPGYPASGGGVFSNNGTVNVSNSTFTGNGSSYAGGGIGTSNSTVIVTNSTLSGNSAEASGGIYAESATVTLKNTIVTHSLADGNCGVSIWVGGTIIDGGGNLSYPDATCPGINADPLLGPLQNNGGPTETMALLPGSAAIDAADDAICTADPVNSLDQRGVVRPQGLHCDIGAYEAELPPPPSSTTIDIKPGEPDNGIDLSERGKMAVAVLSSEGFDATNDLMRGAFTFGRTGAEKSLLYKKGNVPNCNVKDVNADGLPDLVCQFLVKLTGFQVGDTEGVLVGMTVAGGPFEGRDMVNVVP